MEAFFATNAPMKEIREAMLSSRMAVLPRYLPSILKRSLVHQDSLHLFGSENVARLHAPDDDGKCMRILWDVLCIFSHVPDSTVMLRPSEILDLTEHGHNPERLQGYTLCHILHLILEVSPNMSGLYSKYEHASSSRICGERACCNPYHRGKSLVHREHLSFTKRLHMHKAAFDLQYNEHDRDENCGNTTCTCAWKESTPISVYLGKLAVGKNAKRHRVYIVGYKPVFSTIGAHRACHSLDVTCQTDDGENEWNISLKCAIAVSTYEDCVDMLRTIEASGGILAMVRAITECT